MEVRRRCDGDPDEDGDEADGGWRMETKLMEDGGWRMEAKLMETGDEAA